MGPKKSEKKDIEEEKVEIKTIEHLLEDEKPPVESKEKEPVEMKKTVMVPKHLVDEDVFRALDKLFIHQIYDEEHVTVIADSLLLVPGET